MEVYITNLDSGTTDKQLHSLLESHLKTHGISVFEVSKRPGGTVAWLTIADIQKACKFLTSVGSSPVSSLLNPSRRPAVIRQSNKAANPQLLRVLQKEENDARGNEARRRLRKGKTRHEKREQSSQDQVRISKLDCGSWETQRELQNDVFQVYHQIAVQGYIQQKGRELVIILDQPSHIEIHIDVLTITSLVILSGKQQATGVSVQVAVITLALAPRLFKPSGVEVLQQSRHRLTRIDALPGTSTNTTGSCLSYRITADPSVPPQRLERYLRSMMYSVTTIKSQRMKASQTVTSVQDALARLNPSLEWMTTFACKFQIQALWANAVLPLMEVWRLLPYLKHIRDSSGEAHLTSILRRLSTQLREADYQVGGYVEALNTLKRLQSSSLHEMSENASLKKGRDEVSVHRVAITPTGMYLYGPEETPANRVLRHYRKHNDCFLRVTFADENEDRIPFDRDVSNDQILRGRFLHILRNGLDLADEHFTFLGFSHSSLRSQSCWFMRPFYHDGSLLLAQNLVKSLGNFNNIRCPAKCAARIGQAFSETTSAVSIDPAIVKVFADVQYQQYVFTDGCGTISKSVWELLKSVSTTKLQPSAYQIRYQGAKGMISLDTRLRGLQVCLRDSMVKFTGSTSSDIEICGTNARALPFKLNRQLIVILEDLNIKAQVFEDLQLDALERLRSSATSRKSAIDFLKIHLSDSATGLPTLLKKLADVGFDVTEDSFLREILGALLQVELRDLKHRSRILVPDAVTLYGISDESAILQEDEVFVTYADAASQTQNYLSGRVTITRSPALHPGDIQVVNAVRPPDDSHLWNLGNCVVFSQHGKRDLPSMLSGGDLDGDLFNIIYDQRLIPKSTHPPAAYTAARPQQLDRPVTADDMTTFFVDFMQNDQLGRIATLHQVFADLEGGTRSPECLKLAELHSTAVDFSKTGAPVDVTQIPRAPKYRPDFMAPTTSVKVENGIDRNSDAADANENEPRRFRYYESKKVLGRLYRAIDEDLFFDNLEDDTSSIFSHEPSDNVLRDLLKLTEGYARNLQWQQYIDIAMEVKEHYEYEMLDMMTQYAPSRVDLLSEKEVWIGKIVGRSGAGNKFQREQSDFLKTRFNRGMRDIREWMEERMAEADEGFLCLAVACLHVAVRNPMDVSNSKVDRPLKSFGWFAAGMCLPELIDEQLENESAVGNRGDSAYEARLQLAGLRLSS